VGSYQGGAMTPEERVMRARVGAHALHARYDSRELTRPARAAFNARFEREVDPDGKLTPEERARRAEHARRSWYLKLALKSAQARRRAS
jgi:hypothetical protein